MIKNTTKQRSGITTAKIIAHLTLIVNAIIMAPKTMNGLLNNNLSAKFRPF